MFVGIDAGGTKTAGLLVDGSGRVLARHRGAACALVGDPTAEQQTFLAAFLDALCQLAGLDGRAGITALCLGINGIDFDDEFEGQMAGVSAALQMPRERIRLVNDGIIALAAATSDPRAMIIQHGTGMTSAYRTAVGQEEPYDRLSVGRLADIRQDLIRIVARMIDGRHAPSPLREQTLAYFGLTPESFAPAFYRNQVPWELRKATGDLIMDAWRSGDPAARILVERQIREYCMMAQAMYNRMGSGPATLALGGGIIKLFAAEARAQLERELWLRMGDLRIVSPALAPEYGAVLLAAALDGAPVEPLERAFASASASF